MKMTHAQLAELHDAQDWAALWKQGLPAVGTALGDLLKSGSIGREDIDDDLLQEAALAAGEAIRSWSPLERKFYAHVALGAKRAIVDLCLIRLTGGIGSEWTAKGGRQPAAHVSFHTENDTEADGEGVTYLQDNFTYADDPDGAPGELGDPGLELQRQTAQQAATTLISTLSSEDAALIRAVVYDETTFRDYAKLVGRPVRNLYNKAEKILAQLAQKQKTSAVWDTGVQDWKGVKQHYPAAERHAGFWNGAVSVMEGNPIWSEKVGGVYNDWSWKPQPQDLQKRKSRGIVRSAA